MLRPEQKTVELMKDLLKHFSSADDLVLEHFVEMLSRVKVCLLLDNRRIFLSVRRAVVA